VTSAGPLSHARHYRTQPISALPHFQGRPREIAPRQRQVVVLHYLCDFTVEEVAGILGRATGTVKAHLHTAREKLKASLGEEAPR
jgi:DNA-binding NarL/FixJ family response regulator